MNVDFDALVPQLRDRGFATARNALSDGACEKLIERYSEDALYRSTIRMQRHGYGRGEYRYYAYPLPEPVAELRTVLYAQLAPLANQWNDALGLPERYPANLADYLQRCHAAGQKRPTPLILTYGAGDFNRLHQDVYGALGFPLQATVMLSRRSDYAGGESVFVMQRPRSQSRAAVVTAERGDLIVFPNKHHPVASARGFSRENVRHGISEVTAGARYALGIIFHDAQ
jgi:uncharacterized protein